MSMYVVVCFVICFSLFVDGKIQAEIVDCMTLTKIQPTTTLLTDRQRRIFFIWKNLERGQWNMSLLPEHNTFRRFSFSKNNLFFYLAVQNDSLTVKAFSEHTADSSVNFILKRSLRDGLYKLIHANTSRVVSRSGTASSEENICLSFIRSIFK